MTPGQIAAVEDTLASMDVDELSADFYRRAFAEDPSLVEMFTSDPALQRARFAAELDKIVSSIRSMEMFEPEVRALGARHRRYGVRAAHYKLMGRMLLAAVANALDDRWTPEVEEAWSLAYNLTAETMLLGAMDRDR